VTGFAAAAAASAKPIRAWAANFTASSFFWAFQKSSMSANAADAVFAGATASAALPPLSAFCNSPLAWATSFIFAGYVAGVSPP
jgi:hypothetical protein